MPASATSQSQSLTVPNTDPMGTGPATVPTLNPMAPGANVTPGMPTGILAGAQSGAATYGASTLGTPTQMNVTSDQTAAGQMAKLADPNNPYYQAWATAGAEGAAQRGFTGNSSIQQSGILDSVMRNATPIATNDANTFNKAALYNTDTANQFGIKNMDAVNAAGANNAAQINQQRQVDVGATTQRYGIDTNAATQQSIAALNTQSQQLISAAHDANSSLLQNNSAAQQAYNTYATSIANINEQTGMDANAKDAAIQTLTQTFNNQMTGIRQATGLTGQPGSIATQSSIPSSPISMQAAQAVGGVNVASQLTNWSSPGAAPSGSVQTPGVSYGNLGEGGGG